MLSSSRAPRWLCSFRGYAPLLLVLLTALAQESLAVRSPNLFVAGEANEAVGWTTCPCDYASLCEPIQSSTAAGSKHVFVFHTTPFPGTNHWMDYDWSVIGTICVFGSVDPDLYCHAHKNGARVVLPSHPDTNASQWLNDTAMQAWLDGTVAKVAANFADGVNLDVEIAARLPEEIRALTHWTNQTKHALLKLNPSAQLTFDSESMGVDSSEQTPCGTQGGRDYNFPALASIVDFIVVMDYDSSDPDKAYPTELWLEAGPGGLDPPYTTRGDALAACKRAGAPRLCTTTELTGFEACAKGWCSDGEGWWMHATTKGCGTKGFNSHSGPGRAWCCGVQRDPCDTCFYAQSGLPVVKAGVECFRSMGIPTSKLVLAFPWYGKDYSCKSQDAAIDGHCHVDGLVNRVFPDVLKLMNETDSERLWDDHALSPHFFYNDTNGTRHRVEYDDSKSLRLKYAYAHGIGARGIGMWHASALDYTRPMGKQFWVDLKEAFPP